MIDTQTHTSLYQNIHHADPPRPSPPPKKTKALRAAGVKFRILVTGPVIEAPATGFVRLNDTEFLLPNATITRGDLSRIATEFFLVSEKQDAAQVYGACRAGGVDRPEEAGRGVVA